MTAAFLIVLSGILERAIVKPVIGELLWRQFLFDLCLRCDDIQNEREGQLTVLRQVKQSVFSLQEEEAAAVGG